MGSKRIEEDFEIKWLETFKEVSEYHRNFYGGQMISLSLSDLKKLVEGKFLAWSSGFDEYSEVLYLNEDAKKVLNKIVKGESSCLKKILLNTKSVGN